MKENKIIEMGKNLNYFILGIVLGAIVGFCFLVLFSPSCPSRVGMSLEVARGNACQMLASLGCNYDINSIPAYGFDANKDGKIDEKDTLLALCQIYYGCEDETCCRERVCLCY